mgnify:CR=1 FL=1
MRVADGSARSVLHSAAGQTLIAGYRIDGEVGFYPAWQGGGAGIGATTAAGMAPATRSSSSGEVK